VAVDSVLAAVAVDEEEIAVATGADVKAAVADVAETAAAVAGDAGRYLALNKDKRLL